MSMGPRAAKVALTAHVVSSVGWLGAVACSLGLGIAGVASDDAGIVRSAYVSLDVVGRLVLVPLGLASLATGLVQSLGTRWGLFRHYWVMIKLIMNLVAVGVLVLYLQTLDTLASLASDPGVALDLVRSPSPVLHAVA